MEDAYAKSKDIKGYEVEDWGNKSGKRSRQTLDR
jgi:hypothetical protein